MEKIETKNGQVLNKIIDICEKSFEVQEKESYPYHLLEILKQEGVPYNIYMIITTDSDNGSTTRHCNIKLLQDENFNIWSYRELNYFRNNLNSSSVRESRFIYPIVKLKDCTALTGCGGNGTSVEIIMGIPFEMK